MMLQHGLSITMLLLSAGLAAIGLQQRYNWLDRVVQFQKNKFLNEVKELAPINMNVELRSKSEGFEDSRDWDYNSVLRLLSLIRASETAKPVYKALRRMLQPTRRIMMSMKQSMKYFPSLQNNLNNLYYDVEYPSSEEDATSPAPPVPEDQAVIVVSNPVEARLPNAQISVKLLREILEARARAARQMPTTTAVIPWIEFVKNQTTTEAASTAATASTGTTETQESTTAAGGDMEADGGSGTESQPDGETGAGGDEATSLADAETTAGQETNGGTETTPEETGSPESATEEGATEEGATEENM